MREGTPVRFVLNRLFRPLKPHQLYLIFTCQSRLVSQLHTFIIFLANKSKFLRSKTNDYVYVVVNFLSQLIFIFRLFLGMVMNANEFETKEI